MIMNTPLLSAHSGPIIMFTGFGHACPGPCRAVFADVLAHPDPCRARFAAMKEYPERSVVSPEGEVGSF